MDETETKATPATATAAEPDGPAIDEMTPDSPATAEKVVPPTPEHRKSQEILRKLVLPRPVYPPQEEYEPIETFVEKTIQEQYDAGGCSAPLTDGFRMLIEALRSFKDLKLVRSLLLAFGSAGRGATFHLILKQGFLQLVHVILRMDPFKYHGTISDEEARVYTEVADAQLYLLTQMCSANSLLVKASLRACWKKVANVPCAMEKTSRYHATIATICRKDPWAADCLMEQIKHDWPHRAREEEKLTLNATQALRTLDYVPQILNRLLETYIDGCLSIDVEIFISDDGEVSVQFMKKKAAEEVDVMDATSPVKSTTAANEPEKHCMDVPEMALKLDKLMLTLFEFVDAKKHLRRNIFALLLDVFSNHFLDTHKSKFVQFVILQICGLDVKERVEKRRGGSSTNNDNSKNNNNDNIDLQMPFDDEDGDYEDETLYHQFATVLVNILVDDQTRKNRQIAACYLASFVSRATFVGSHTVCETVAALLRLAEKYISELDELPQSMQLASHRHPFFYSLCQAAFYIMCFRGKEAFTCYKQQEVLLQEGEIDDVEFSQFNISAERWTKICFHRLKPLSFCLDSVKEEFLECATVLDLLDSQVVDQLSRIEKHDPPRRPPRKRVRAIRIPTASMTSRKKERRSGGVGGLGKGHNPLDSFFPFDPYLLQDSYVFVQPFYKHWTGGITPEDLIADEVDQEGVPTDATACSSVTGVEDADNAEDDESVVVLESDDDDEEDDDDDDDDQSDGFGVVVDTEHVAAGKSPLNDSTTPVKTHAELKEAWTSTLKRARAPSIENGSW